MISRVMPRIDLYTDSLLRGLNGNFKVCACPVKRRDLLRRVHKECTRKGISNITLSEGGNHSIITVGHLRIPIPRHRELGDLPALAIMKQLQSILGERWWER